MAGPDVGTPCAAYLEMAKRWELIRDLLGGTIRMREQATKWLPREPREREEDYRIRLDRSILYGALGDTIETLTAKPYSKAIRITGELPETLEPLLEDADLAGQTFQQLARGSFASGIQAGVDHYLVDRTLGAERGSYADEKSGAVRAAIIHVPAENVIGWRAERGAGGGYRLSQVRIRECVEAAKGDFDTETVEQILVLDAPSEGAAGSWRRYQRKKRETADGGTDWQEVGKGTLTRPGIPLVTWYTRRKGFMVATPPLDDLAWLNLRHWQSYSDQSNILRFARFAQLAATGLSNGEFDGDEKTATDSGPNRMLMAKSPDAKFYFVEHSGKAMESGFADLKTLEDRMEALGQQPMIERVGDATATGVMAAQGKTMTTIQSWIRNQEIALEAAFKIAAELQGAELPDDFSIDIFSDFQAASGDPTQAQLVALLGQGGLLDKKTTLMELKRRGVISEDVDIDEILERSQREGPTLAQIGAQMRMAGKDDGDDKADDDKPAGKPGAGDAEGGSLPPKPGAAAA